MAQKSDFQSIPTAIEPKLVEHIRALGSEYYMSDDLNRKGLIADFMVNVVRNRLEGSYTDDDQKQDCTLAALTVISAILTAIGENGKNSMLVAKIAAAIQDSMKVDVPEAVREQAEKIVTSHSTILPKLTFGGGSGSGFGRF